MPVGGLPHLAGPPRVSFPSPQEVLMLKETETNHKLDDEAFHALLLESLEG